MQLHSCIFLLILWLIFMTSEALSNNNEILSNISDDILKYRGGHKMLSKYKSLISKRDTSSGDYENESDYDNETEVDEDSTCIGNCKREDFYVNFTEIGWQKWIVYPRSYNAYYCDGDCPSPLKIKRNEDPALIDAQVTNHAQIMSILEYKQLDMNSRKITKCVPTKLESLQVIYLNENDELEIKEYNNMIVKQCGCR